MLQKTFMVGIPSLGPSWVANEFGSHYCIGQEETDNHALSTHTHTHTLPFGSGTWLLFRYTHKHTHIHAHIHTNINTSARLTGQIRLIDPQLKLLGRMYRGVLQFSVSDYWAPNEDSVGKDLCYHETLSETFLGVLLWIERSTQSIRQQTFTVVHRCRGETGLNVFDNLPSSFTSLLFFSLSFFSFISRPSSCQQVTCPVIALLWSKISQINILREFSWSDGWPNI